MNVKQTIKNVILAISQSMTSILTTSVVIITLPVAAFAEGTKLHDTTVYGTISPTLDFIDDGSVEDGDSSSIDLRDYNSFAGIKGSFDIGNGIKGIYQGEWIIDLKSDGNFGDSRRAYAGLEWEGHRAAFGKQRPPQYLLIGQYIDIFNNERDPFGYTGPYFVDKMLTYRYTAGNLQVMAAGQFNGSEGSNQADLFNIGASYKFNNVYLATSYIKTTEPSTVDITLEGEENTNLAVALSTTFNNFYFALVYQDFETDTDPLIGDIELTGDTFGAVASYDFNHGYQFKVGGGNFDDGLSDIETEEYDGFFVGLSRKVADNVVVHIDYYEKNYPEREDDSVVGVGIKYDLSVKL